MLDEAWINVRSQQFLDIFLSIAENKLHCRKGGDGARFDIRIDSLHHPLREVQLSRRVDRGELSMYVGHDLCQLVQEGVVTVHLIIISA